MMITLQAEAKYGYEGKQYVARIVGRDPKFTFTREFIGQKWGKRRGSTTAEVDTPGLYVICDVDKKGKSELFRIVLDSAGGLIELRAGGDNLDNLDGKDAAMQIAKRLDLGESLEQIVELQTGLDGKPKYRIRTKAQAQKASVAVTVDAATAQCWAVLEALPEREAKKVLSALKAKLAPPPKAPPAPADDLPAEPAPPAAEVAE